jgi:hypothetical protein
MKKDSKYPRSAWTARGSAWFVLLLVTLPATGWAQSGLQPEPILVAPAQPSQSTSDSITPTPTEQASVVVKEKPERKPKKEEPPGQSNRIFWVVPNFAAVSANTQLPPLSSHDKFLLAMHDSFDYSSFVWTGILATQSLMLNSDPELGHGFKGYTRYYWRTFVDGVSGTYFTEAIIPSLTHEDPRYYTLGRGGFFRRAGYALSRTVVTKTDSGHTTFSWSEVGGNACEAALSNFYYPPQERGLNQTMRGWGTQMESAALNNIVKEFWPDIRHKILRGK